MDDSTRIFRVEARAPGRLRQIDSVLAPLPIVVGDSAVIGLRWAATDSSHSAGTRRLFRVNLATGRMESWPVAPDVWYVAFDVLPSPNGEYYAYVGDDTVPPGGTLPIVRELRSGRAVFRGLGGGGCECDVDENHVRWFPPDSFEIAVAHSELAKGGWLLFRGRASTGRVRVDTILHQPTWH